eukprot:13923289-Alexandrium_andersonii.AAC.1
MRIRPDRRSKASRAATAAESLVVEIADHCISKFNDYCPTLELSSEIGIIEFRNSMTEHSTLINSAASQSL